MAQSLIKVGRKETYKELIERFVVSDTQTKRNLILEQIADGGYEPKVQNFESDNQSGCNIIAETLRTVNEQIVVTSHYDGAGVLDNAQGVAVTLGLMKRLRNERGITFLFTDLEEKGQLGARAYLEKFGKERIIYNINIDGAGTGELLIDLKNTKKLRARLSNGGTAELELHSDADVFEENGIPAIWYATLPENEVAILKTGELPPLWQRVLYADDDFSLISERNIRNTIKKIYDSICNIRGSTLRRQAK